MHLIHSRRKLLRAVTAGIGAPLLLPFGRGLVKEALGNENKRRLAVFFIVGETIPYKDSTPVEADAANLKGWGAVDRSGITLPDMFSGMAQHTDRLILVDGLANVLAENPGGGGSGGVQHGSGWGCLTGLRPLDNKPESGGNPAGISIDQFIAQGQKDETPVSSVRIGFNGPGVRDYSSTTFSAGRNKPLSHVGNPDILRANLFGATGMSDNKNQHDGTLRTSLLDSMRADINRLNSRLAGPEKERFEEFLAVIDNYDKKQEELSNTVSNCNEPPNADNRGPAKKAESMMAMATLALRCGLTNVVGLSIGSGFAHDDLKLLNEEIFKVEKGYGAHGDPVLYARSMNRLYKWQTGMASNLLNGLGDLADQTVFMMTAASGSTDKGHHANLFRWFTMVYDGTGTLKTAPGGRYLRYTRGSKSVVDLYSSLAHAAGVPTDNFGAGGFNRARGPLPELMA